MRFFLLLSLLFLFKISLGKNPPVILKLTDYGAIVNDGKDDYDAFKRVFDELKKNPRDIRLLLPNGVIDIKKRIIIDFLEFNFCIEGEEKSVIRIHNEGFAQIQPNSKFYKLPMKVLRNERKFQIEGKNLRFIKKGSIIHISSNSAFESGWNYKENDIHKISSINNNVIELSEPLIFNYDPSIEEVVIRVYEPVKLIIKKINFEIAQLDNKTRATAIVLAGGSLLVKDVSVQYLGDQSLYFHNGISISACIDSEFKNIKLQNLQYGVLMNFVRNFKGINTSAFYTRHAYVPSTASFNIFIDKLIGKYCHSVMDAHVSFNVHYKNVVDSFPTIYPDCRALGTFIENVKIIPAKDLPYNLYAYWSVQTLVKDYEFLYKEFETHFKNVHFVAPKPGRFNGLTSYSIGRLIVENCTTHNVAFYGDPKYLEKVEIKDSKLGMLYVDGQKTSVTNTVFSGVLFNNAPFVMKFTGIGNVSLNKVKVEQYDPNETYLFSNFHNQSRRNSMNIYNSSFGTLKGWTNKLVDKGLPYNVEIKNSSFDFIEEIPEEVKNIKQFIIKAKNVH